jgi:hypothetical protein
MGALLVLKSPSEGQVRGFEARLVWPVRSKRTKREAAVA